MKYILITGASTGIGYDAARELIANGFHVLGSVRKQADADRVQAELGANFTPLLFDVTDGEAIAKAVPVVESIVGNNGLAGLVNNAGIAMAGPLKELTIDDIKWQFEVNVFGLMAVTQAFLPLLGATKNAPHPPGRIVNITSISGEFAFPFFGAYAGSKFAVEAMSDALRRELIIYGIDVIVIGPASVKTPIWSKKGGVTENKFAGTDYEKQMELVDKITAENEKTGMPVELVSQTILTALTHPKPRTRYGLYNGITSRLLPHLPVRLVDQQVAKQMKLERLK